MLKKRIIPCLDIHNGRTVKGVNFLGLRDAGDPVVLAKRYQQEGADELVFLDISATVEKRRTLVKLVTRIAEEISIPFTVGGGINSVEAAKAVVLAGADKVSVNSSAIRQPELIRHLAEELGSQAVVVAIDSKEVNGRWRVVTDCGRRLTNLHTLEWAQQVQALGAGELLLTSMERDGTKAGFDLLQLQAIEQLVHLPLIASGGAGSTAHFAELFHRTRVTGALAASVFHFGEIPIPNLKHDLKQLNIPMR